MTKLYRWRVLVGLLLLCMIFERSTAQTKPELIKVTLQTPLIYGSAVKVRVFNNDVFPHIVLVRAYLRGVEDSLIGEAIQTIPAKENTLVELKSEKNQRLLSAGSVVAIKTVHVLGDNRNWHKDNRFQIPFMPDTKVLICQSPDGPLSTHTKDRINAIDFCAPEKTPIVAAKDGVVIDVIQHFTESGLNPALLEKGNGIRILHDDGLISDYVHIYPHSASVKIGDRVKRGQQIALVGSIGYSSGPHLHFEVMEGATKLTTENTLIHYLPITFVDPDNAQIHIKYGAFYSVYGLTCASTLRKDYACRMNPYIK